MLGINNNPGHGDVDRYFEWIKITIECFALDENHVKCEV